MLHVAALVVIPGCAVAAWWQINRAQDGNQLSYFYSVMWPAFALLALWFWWMLIHTDFDKAGLKGMRQEQDLPAEDTSTSVVPPLSRAEEPVARVRASDEEDPELAAYNARLAELAARGPKTWSRPESVVVRRAR